MNQEWRKEQLGQCFVWLVSNALVEARSSWLKNNLTHKVQFRHFPTHISDKSAASIVFTSRRTAYPMACCKPCYIVIWGCWWWSCEATLTERPLLRMIDQGIRSGGNCRDTVFWAERNSISGINLTLFERFVHIRQEFCKTQSSFYKKEDNHWHRLHTAATHQVLILSFIFVV